MRNRRLILAVVGGMAVAVIQASREYLRFRDLIGGSPNLANQLRDHFLGVWSLLLVVSGIASVAVVLLLSRASGSRFAPLFALAIVALLCGAFLPIYWYTYLDKPEGLHVHIPGIERYTPTLSAITALVVYGLAGLMIRSDRQSNANAA